MDGYPNTSGTYITKSLDSRLLNLCVISQPTGPPFMLSCSPFFWPISTYVSQSDFFFIFIILKVNNKIIFINPKFKKINKNLELKKYIVIEILILIYKLYNCNEQYTILIFKSGQPPKPLKQNLKVKITSLDKVS